MTDIPLEILGTKVSEPIKHTELEIFAKPLNVERVRLNTDEFTSVCPVTGQPDFCTIEIDYEPKDCCIESKSLKLYLWKYRNEGSFCEDLASKIVSDLNFMLCPWRITVTVTQKPRGGIELISTADVDNMDEGQPRITKDNRG